MTFLAAVLATGFLLRCALDVLLEWCHGHSVSARVPHGGTIPLASTKWSVICPNCRIPAKSEAERHVRSDQYIDRMARKIHAQITRRHSESLR